MGRAAAEDELHFYTLSGLLTAKQADGWIELDFPARTVEAAEPPAGLAEALGLKSCRFAGRYKDNFLFEVGSEAELRALAPDFAALKAQPPRAVGVTCRSDSLFYDFVSRFFAPKMGINEDPVTGSVHCALVPYWGQKLGKTEMQAYQASARGGALRLRWLGERVVLAGQAVTVVAGELI
jgi:predicted PhzF superfamily epimerase YddE/YHI9